MFVRSTQKCELIEAADESLLRVLFNPLLDDIETQYSMAHATVPKGKTTLAHQLATTEVYYIISGSGIMYIDDESQKVKSGDVIYIPANAIQKIENKSEEELVFLCIVDPAWEARNETILL